jgi:chaperonin GroES
MEETLTQDIDYSVITNDLTEEQLGALASRVKEDYDADKLSRQDNEDMWDRINKLISFIPEEKTTPFPNASNVKLPLTLNACITFAARVYPMLINGNDVVKVQVTGDDSGLYKENPQDPQNPIEVVKPGLKQKIADKVSVDMSNKVLNEIEGWEENLDKLLQGIALYGTYFRKVYRDGNGRIKSELVAPQFLVVNNDATFLEKSRHSFEFFLQGYEIEERIRSGEFLDFEYDKQNMGFFSFIEQYTRYDLDGDGYAEPLVVTYNTENSKVIKVARNFYDIKKEKKKIISIEAGCFFTPFIFNPDPKGGFYGVGFGHLLSHLNESVNTMANQTIDAATLSNSGGGFIGRGLRLKGGQQGMPMGKYLMVDTDGKGIADNIYDIKRPLPSQTLYDAMQFLFDYGKKLGGMADVLQGESLSHQAATTTLAMVENGLTEFRAVFKRIYRGFKGEFKKIASLMYGKDFVRENEIMPIADMSALTSMQKMARSQVLMELAAAGYVNGKEATRRRLQDIGVTNIDELLIESPASPEVQLQMQVEERLTKEADAMLMKQQNSAADIEIKTAKVKADTQLTLAKTMETLQKVEQSEQAQDNIESQLTEVTNANKPTRVRGLEKPELDDQDSETPEN